MLALALYLRVLLLSYPKSLWPPCVKDKPSCCSACTALELWCWDLGLTISDTLVEQLRSQILSNELDIWNGFTSSLLEQNSLPLFQCIVHWTCHCVQVHSLLLDELELHDRTSLVLFCWPSCLFNWQGPFPFGAEEFLPHSHCKDACTQMLW